MNLAAQRKVPSKKLVVFCDGTWNDLRMPHLTNVARLAKCVAQEDGSGIPQVVYYDEGVVVPSNISPTVDRWVSWLGGALGRGLDRKIESAYRFLVLNYSPHDEIYIFGFSRGAYTARSLCGLIRKCGILKRDCFDQVPAALDLYRDPRHPNDAAVVSFRRRYSHRRTTGPEDQTWFGTTKPDEDEIAGFQPSRRGRAASYQYRPQDAYQMMYLGVWDTVGSLGLPSNWDPDGSSASRYRFHDTKASSLLSSIRHAASIDEDRAVFDLTGIDNIFDLNAEWADQSGWNVDTPANPRFVPYSDRPYQQKWFAGDHSAVGGGWYSYGLSSAALVWIAQGAANAGLKFKEDHSNELWQASQSINPISDWRFKLDGTRETVARKDFFTVVGGEKRRQGPQSVDEVSHTAKQRWFADSTYRPYNLRILLTASWPPDTTVSKTSFPAAPADLPTHEV